MDYWYYRVGAVEVSTDAPGQVVERIQVGQNSPSLESKLKLATENEHRSVEPDATESKPPAEDAQESTAPKRQITTVSRLDVAPSYKFTQSVRLEEGINSVEGKSKRRELEHQLRKVRETKQFSVNPYWRVYDLDGNLIGRFHGNERSEGSFRLQKTSLVLGYGFDFSPGADQGVYLRTTAYTTPLGWDSAELYILDRTILKRDNRRGVATRTRNHAKAILRKENTWDFTIAGYSVHFNRRGKIETFTKVPCDIADQLTQPSEGQNFGRFDEYVRWAKDKRWIGTINGNTNEFIGESVRALSHVLNQVFYRA